MRKVITIDGKDVPIAFSADTPRQYREAFGRDLIQDMMGMQKSVDTSILENLAYIMAKAADPELQDVTIHDWLQRFDSVTAMYSSADQILAAWTDNTQTGSESKKK
ncbi:MAG: hypothetical protein IKF99_01245 [Oscillospiraceae bacterium]|nr:hypothetical protein [Oscillospiraceae bacterium]